MLTLHKSSDPFYLFPIIPCLHPLGVVTNCMGGHLLFPRTGPLQSQALQTQIVMQWIKLVVLLASLILFPQELITCT